MFKFTWMAVLCLPVMSQAGPFIAQLDQASNSIAGNGTVSSPYAFLMLDDSTTDNALAANQVRMRVQITPSNAGNAEFGKIGWNLGGVTSVDFSLFAPPTGTGSGNAALWTLDTQAGGVPISPFGKFGMTLAPNTGSNRLASVDFLMLFDDPNKAKISNFIAGNADGFYYGLEYRPTSGAPGSVAAVPEPSSLLLMGAAALLGSVVYRRRK